MSGSSRGVPHVKPKWCQNGTWLAGWPELFVSTRARGATRKKVSIFAGSEYGWIRKCSKCGCRRECAHGVRMGLRLVGWVRLLTGIRGTDIHGHGQAHKRRRETEKDRQKKRKSER